MLLKGGPTNAGTKLPKTMPRQDWTCSRGHGNRGYVVRCLMPKCNEPRGKS